MFDIGISELGVIGAVALIVIGPERLPKVARTVGTLIGRAQRYVSDVKAEVGREMQLDDLRKMKDTVERSAREVHSTLNEEIATVRGDLESTWRAGDETPAAGPVQRASRPAMTPLKRVKWRRNLVARQSAVPLWFRNASRRRSRVTSGAARVARYRSQGGAKTAADGSAGS